MLPINLIIYFNYKDELFTTKSKVLKAYKNFLVRFARMITIKINEILIIVS